MSLNSSPAPSAASWEQQYHHSSFLRVGLWDIQEANLPFSQLSLGTTGTRRITHDLMIYRLSPITSWNMGSWIFLLFDLFIYYNTFCLLASFGQSWLSSFLPAPRDEYVCIINAPTMRGKSSDSATSISPGVSHLFLFLFFLQKFMCANNSCSIIQ